LRTAGRGEEVRPDPEKLRDTLDRTRSVQYQRTRLWTRHALFEVAERERKTLKADYIHHPQPSGSKFGT
jgi:hypothetical protein